MVRMLSTKDLSASSLASRMSNMALVRRANILAQILRHFRATTLLTPINFLDFTCFFSRDMVLVVFAYITKISLPEIKSLYCSFGLLKYSGLFLGQSVAHADRPPAVSEGSKC